MMTEVLSTGSVGLRFEFQVGETSAPYDMRTLGGTDTHLQDAVLRVLK